MKTIHHILISHTSPNLSGGEKSMLEMVYGIFKKNPCVEQVIHTSETGAKLFSLLLEERNLDSNVRFNIVGPEWVEKYSEILAFYLRIPQSFFSIFKFSKGDHTILSHDSFLPTIIYSWCLYKKNKTAKWEAIFHMKGPSIWRGWEGEYTNKLNFPTISLIRYKLEELFFFELTKRNLKKIITVNPIYEKFLSLIYKEVVVMSNYSGIDKLNQVNYKENIKNYDLCFMGRFHKQKGIFELFDIVMKLREQYDKNISLVVMGGGNKKMEFKFDKLIKFYKLDQNIKYLGYISDHKKYEILSQSKIFVFPSYYESFGHVILEATQLGIPTVAYDLPPFIVFGENIIKSPALDNNNMVQNITKLLSDKVYYSNMVTKSLEFSKQMFQSTDISKIID